QHRVGRIALGVDGVVQFHISGGGRGPIPLPQAQSAGTKEGIGLPAKPLAQHLVRDLTPERGHSFAVLFVGFRSTDGTFHMLRLPCRSACYYILSVLTAQPRPSVDIIVKKLLYFRKYR